MNAPRIVCSALVLTLTGCVTLDTRTPTIEAYESVRQGPALPINRNVTNFSEGLRCMDKLLADHGARLSLMVEDITDKTQKSPAGTTEMFIGALSSMARRSQAIRAIAFSRDDMRNISDYMLKSDSKASFKPSNVPDYAVRGSISQFDDSTARSTQDAGFSFGPLKKIAGGLGMGKSSSVSEVALDMQLVRANDFSIVAGVNSQNKAAILQDGSGSDGDISMSKLGINFQTTVSKSDGKSVALRNLVDLAAIELVGRGTKTPYWTCIGVAGNNADIQREIADWFEAMTTTEKVVFFLREFRAMQLFDANETVDGDLLKLAFAAYAEALDVSRRDTISLELFQKHFAANRATVEMKTQALFEAAKNTPIKLTMELLPNASGTAGSSSGPAGQIGGARIVLTPEQSAFLYCFSQDEASRQVRPVYPLGTRTATRLASGKPVLLSELTRQAMPQNPARPITVGCYTSRTDRSTPIAAWLRNGSGAAIRGIDSLDQISEQLAANGVPVGNATVRLGGPKLQ